MKVLYLDTGLDSTSEYFRKERMKVSNCYSQCLYKKIKKGILFKIVQFVGIYFFPPILYLIYGKWKKEVNNYDMFIIVSRRSARYAVNYIKRKTKGKRIIVWYWNLVTHRELTPRYCKNIGCETWSFDKEDCKKYNMKFGDTYYFPPKKDNIQIKKKYDVFYVGINRPGREETINHISEYLESNGYNYLFNLTASPTDSKRIQKKYARRLNYEEIISYIKESNAILDLNRENQSGMTLRPLEALFFNKKLITNNEYIKEYKAYSQENVFIIRNDNFNGLDDFLKKKPKTNDDFLLRYYSFENWLQRIIENN